MTGDLDDLPFGQRLQRIRERRGKSRSVVAGLVGRSSEWLKAVEKGTIHPPRLEMMLRLAEVLELRDLAELTGARQLPMSVGRHAGHPAVPAIREALRDYTLTTTAAPPDLAALRSRTGQAWRLWHTSPTQRTDVGQVLPGLVRDAQNGTRLLDGPDRRAAHAILADVYALSEQMLSWVCEPQLLWMVADRGMSSAREADDPQAIAGAAWVLGNVLRATGEEEHALALARDAAGMLAPILDSGTDANRAMWGALQLHAAVTSARMGREGEALHYLDQGVAAARRLPDGYAHPWTVFGAANAELHGLSVRVDLYKSREALRAAQSIAPGAVPSVDRQARLWLEMARSYHQERDYVAAHGALTRCYDTSPDAARYHPLARSIAGDLVDHGGRMIEREARDLADKLGLIA